MKANQTVTDSEGITWTVVSIRKNDGKIFPQRWETFRVVTLVAAGIDAECSELARRHHSGMGKMGKEKVTYVYMREWDAEKISI